jgi:hypothetical protein
VSPNNGVPTHFSLPDPVTHLVTVTQEVPSSGCPATFQPAKQSGLRNKLTFSFAIGQAF